MLTASHRIADFTDLKVLRKQLNPSLFPGFDSSITVHDGFQDEHAKTAVTILNAVQQTLTAHPESNTVTTVGHSLGGALALLDGLFLPLHLPPGIRFYTVAYGLPRVGNQAFANYVDQHLPLTHINNKQDPVPTLPAQFLRYVQPNGEVHIQYTGEWDSCPGKPKSSTSRYNN